MTTTLLHGDCRTILATLPDQSVQTVVTSPPYLWLRDYGVEGQIGQESSIDEFVETMTAVFREVRRVLRDDGTCWVNMGDGYAQDSKWGGSSGAKNYTSAAGGMSRARRTTGLKEKDLIGMPWRIAFALQADGWYLRNAIVWDKPNGMPESVTDRFTQNHEYVFLFSKSRYYYFDNEAVKEPAQEHSPSAASFKRVDNKRSSSLVPGNMPTHRADRPDVLYSGGLRNRRSVWRIPTTPYKEAHFATFPEALVEPCILAGSSPQACEVCGAPWERITDRRPALAPDGKNCLKCGKNHGRPKAQTEHTDHRAGNYAVEQFVCVDVVTTGWRPTCGCENVGAGHCVVLDPFAGSGTTLRVAERFGRAGIGIELNPAYIELAEKRTDNVQREMSL